MGLVELEDSPLEFDEKRKKKRRNYEKRKEKSKVAARCRRGRESEYFNAITELLPLPQELSSNIDKSATLRLFMAYIQLRQFLINMNYANKNKNKFHQNLAVEKLHSEAIDGFLLILTLSGNIVFLSENVIKYLGISNVDMLGHNLYDFSHPCDHEEVKAMLHYQEGCEGTRRLRLVRMRCTPNKRESRVKKVSYKVMKCVGKIVNEVKQASCSIAKKDQSHLKLVSLASPIPHPSNIEILLDQTTFLTRHTVDMKFSYVDPRIATMLQYEETDLLNKSMYMYIHTADILQVRSSFLDLFEKGQCDTELYRFMVKNGGFVWIVTQATLIYGNKTPSYPQCVVCVHYINSHVIDKEQVIAEEQMNGNEAASCDDCSLIETTQHVPLQSTNSIFSPLTQDMNTGYLSMKDIGVEITEYKNDPDDLTHLAPTPGDACIPLNISTVADENIKSWMLMDAPIYESSLSDINENTTVLSNATSALRSDPFLSYRDESLLCDAEKSSICLEPISFGCSSEDGSDSLGSTQSEKELHDGRYNMPLEDFPALSVTDSVLWNSSDSSPLMTKNYDPSEDNDSEPCGSSSSLAKLLQSGMHKNCTELMLSNSKWSNKRVRNRIPARAAKNTNYNRKKKLPVSQKNTSKPKYNWSSSSSNDSIEYLDSSLDNHHGGQTICDKVNAKRHYCDPQSKLIKRQRKELISQSSSNTNKGSVLMNLLLDGHCAEYNCDLNNVPKTSNKKIEVPNKIMPVTLAKLLLSNNSNSSNSMNQLKYLTCEDAEVNAPTHDKLLTGTELLNALEEDKGVQAARVCAI